MEGSLLRIANRQEWNLLMDTDFVFVVEFVSSQCESLAYDSVDRRFYGLARKSIYHGTAGLRVHVDHLPEVADVAGITCTPTFSIIHRREILKEIVGQNETELRLFMDEAATIAKQRKKSCYFDNPYGSHQRVAAD